MTKYSKKGEMMKIIKKIKELFYEYVELFLIIGVVILYLIVFLILIKNEGTVLVSYNFNPVFAETIEEETVNVPKLEVAVLYQTISAHKIDAEKSVCESGISIVGICQEIETCYDNNWCIKDTGLRIIFASEGLKNEGFSSGDIIIIEEEMYIIVDQVSCNAGNCHYYELQLEILVDNIDENNKRILI